MIEVLEVAELATESFSSLQARIQTDGAMPAIAIPGRSDSYFALSSEGDFYLLIRLDQDLVLDERRFEAIRVGAGANYQLTDASSGTDLTARYAFVALDAGSRSLLAAFGMLGGVLLRALPQNPTRHDFQALLDDFARLFALRSQVDRRTVVGLWGELWLINEWPVLGPGWHRDVADRFDFSQEELRIEAKTTESPSRVHSFALAQLLPSDKKTIVASITVVADAHGRSIADLLVSVLDQVTAQEGARIGRACLETLAGDLEASADYRFAPAGLPPLLFFEAETIPRVSVPDGAPISKVRFAVDLSTITPTDWSPASL